MIILRGFLTVFLFALFSAVPGAALELRGTVFWLDETNDRQVAAGVEVLVEANRATAVTDSTGFFRVSLPSLFRPGQMVTLVVDAGERVVFRPFGGETLIPEDPVRELVEIELVQKGSKRFLSDEGLEKLIDQSARELARSRPPRTGDSGDSAVDLTRVLREWAQAYGFGLDEVQRELDRWSREVLERSEDAYQRGLAELARENFLAAADEFAQSATTSRDELGRIEEAEKVLAERREEVRRRLVRDLEAEYGAAYEGYEFERAAGVVQELIAIVPRNSDAAAWANYQNDLGIVLKEHGIRSTPSEGLRLLAESVNAYQSSLDIFTQEELPLDWAMVQNNLGVVFQEQGSRADGSGGVKLLSKSVQAFRAALAVFTRKDFPQDWAAIQNNLGIVLKDQATRTDGAGRLKLLSESVLAYRSALDIFTREKLPQDWAMAQNNLGVALHEQGSRTEGEEGIKLLSKAVQHLRAALEVRERESTPQKWAMTQ